MDFDSLLARYFGTSDPGAIPDGALAAGVDRMRVDLGLTQEPGHRFALWSVLHLLGHAPDLDACFKDAGERDAARTFMELAERAEG